MTWLPLLAALLDTPLASPAAEPGRIMHLIGARHGEGMELRLVARPGADRASCRLTVVSGVGNRSVQSLTVGGPRPAARTIATAMVAPLRPGWSATLEVWPAEGASYRETLQAP